MTAAELSCEVLDRRNITVKDKEYWSCWEVSDKEEMGETDGKAEEQETVFDKHFDCSFHFNADDDFLAINTAPAKSSDTHSHLMVFLCFYYFLHWSLILKK